MFGDPSAAGPRRVLSLNPATPRPTPRRACRSPTPPRKARRSQPFGLDELPCVGEIRRDRSPNGELRVAVVEVADARPRAPAAPPLPRAPLAGLTERGPNGPLPIVAANGRTPAQAYARPFTPQHGQPAIAIVIGGLGFNARATTQAIDELPAEVTLSFVPYANNLQSLDRPRPRARPRSDARTADGAVRSRRRRHRPANAARCRHRRSRTCTRLEQLLSRGAGYFGVTNYQGARFATSAQASAAGRAGAAPPRPCVHLVRHRPAHGAQSSKHSARACRTPPQTASSMRAAKPTRSTINC